MFSRFITLALISLLLIPAAFAENLTLDQALEQAISINPRVQAARARLGISEADILSAGALPNPSLVSDNGIAEKTYRLGIEQTFQLGGKRRKRVAVAKAQQQALQAEINTALLDLRTEVRRAYTQLYTAQERLKTYEEIHLTTQRLLDVSQKREKAGDIAELDVLQAQVSALRAANNAQAAFRDKVQARTQLNIYLGQPLATSQELVTPSPNLKAAIQSAREIPLQANATLSDADISTLVDQAYENRPELQQLNFEMETARRQLSLARSERIPDITIAAGPDMVFEEETAFNAFIVASVEIPVLNRQQGPILQARARQTQLGLEQNVLKNRILFEVTNAVTAYLLNRKQVTQYENELLPLAKTVADKARRSFEVGKSNILVPLNAQQAYQETVLEYLQTLSDYQNAINDLERAVGPSL